MFSNRFLIVLQLISMHTWPYIGSGLNLAYVCTYSLSSCMYVWQDAEFQAEHFNAEFMQAAASLITPDGSYSLNAAFTDDFHVNQVQSNCSYLYICCKHPYCCSVSMNKHMSKHEGTCIHVLCLSVFFDRQRRSSTGTSLTEAHKYVTVAMHT
jgi:hypothetical protein